MTASDLESISFCFGTESQMCLLPVMQNPLFGIVSLHLHLVLELQVSRAIAFQSADSRTWSLLSGKRRTDGTECI